MNMDELIKIFLDMKEEWDATKEEWASYKEYIDNYFETLDLSEETYNALLRMIENGVFHETVDPVIITETEEWLTEHITQPVGVVIDNSLTVLGACADAKTTGDRIKNLSTHKVNQPLDGNNQPTNGTAGQALRTKGDGSTEWADIGLPTDEQTSQAVADWLNDHPEATTTVADDSLTETKFSESLRLKTIKDYVTPEMFGAVGDGVTDDVDALDDAVASGKVILLTKQYFISRPINIISNTRIYGDKISKRYDEPEDTTFIKTDGSAFFHSDSNITNLQMFDFSLYNDSSSPNTVFDERLYRCDFRVHGFNIYQFASYMQSVSFDHCKFMNSKGGFSGDYANGYLSDCNFRNCYFSGDENSTTPFIQGLVSSLEMRGCYLDIWYTAFYIRTSYNNIIDSNIFDACYRVFTGNYHEFGVLNNVFMRIKDSAFWTLNQTDWCVFANGLRNRTRSIGNYVDANYYIHTTLTGLSYPNTDSFSAYNALTPNTAIVWNPYPADNDDLKNTRIEELNYKTYNTLETASIIAGSSERFNHQIVNVDNELFINNNGAWKSITLSDEITLTFSAVTIPANSCENLYDNSATNHWLSARQYLVRPAFDTIPDTVTFCCYCHTDGVFRIIVSNPTNSAISFPASTWKVKSFRF